MLTKNRERMGRIDLLVVKKKVLLISVRLQTSATLSEYEPAIKVRKMTKSVFSHLIIANFPYLTRR